MMVRVNLPDKPMSIDFQRIRHRIQNQKKIMTSKELNELLPTVTHENASEKGLSLWKLENGNTIALFKRDWYDIIPKGLPVTCIDGTESLWDKETCDPDSRFGYLAYGIPVITTIQSAIDEAVKEALILAKTMTEHLSQEERNEYFKLAIQQKEGKQ